MEEDPSFRITSRHFKVLSIFLFFQLSTVSIILASVFSPVWGTIDSSEFGLYQCHTPCAKSNYRDQRSIVCNQADLASSLNYPVQSSALSSACTMFKGLERGQYAYIYCAAASIFLAGLCTAYVISLTGKRQSFTYGFLLGLVSLLFQLAGIISWIVENNSLFAGCPGMPTDGSQPQLCAGLGLELGIVGLLLSAVTNGLLFKSKATLKKYEAIEPQSVTVTKSGTMAKDNRGMISLKAQEE